MVSCSDFLRDYSDYRDGLLNPVPGAAMRAHLTACASCGRYDRVLGDGVAQLNALPPIEPSDDFLPRLQHRLFHLEEEKAWWARPGSSGTSAGFVVLLVLLIGVAAWLPLLRPSVPLFELPAVAAAAPQRPDAVHALFRAGPLLVPAADGNRLASSSSNTVFFRYTPIGSHVRHDAGSLRQPR
jgi:hypothetical protein